jgi:hypothetical protein
MSVFVEILVDHMPGIQFLLGRCLIFSLGIGGFLGDFDEHC